MTGLDKVSMSLIIPTAGRPELICKALESALEIKQNINSISSLKDFEIIVVDNNQDENISEQLRANLEKFENEIQIYKQKLPGLTAARHLGARVASGEILCYIDDDARVSVQWAEVLSTAFLDPNLHLAGGPSLPIFDQSIPSWFWQFFLPSQFGGWHCQWLSLSDFGVDVKNIDPRYIWGLNFSIRRETLFLAGGFNPDIMPKNFESFRGDGETGLSEKLLNLNARADYIQKASVLHWCGTDRLNKKYFLKRAYGAGVEQSFIDFRHQGRFSYPKNGLSIKRFIVFTLINLELLFRALFPMGVKTVYLSDFKFRMDLSKAFLKGYREHQSKIKNDKLVAEWVRHESYLDDSIYKKLIGS